MKYKFIDNNRLSHSVEKMAGVLGVTRSGYYAWKKRGISERERANEELAEEIENIQEKVKYRYGSLRVVRELRRRGRKVGRNRVARIMARRGLGYKRGKKHRKAPDRSDNLGIVGNLLERKFEVSEENKVWVSDISYVWTQEGWLYLCVIIDLYSRKVVGWSMGRDMKTGLVIKALMMAMMSRGVDKGLIFHSDRGTQYSSYQFREVLREKGIRQSMSRKGDPWDNAVAESFFKTLKAELLGDRVYRTVREARIAIFEYIEIFYNRERLHSTLGYVSPEEYEKRVAREVA